MSTQIDYLRAQFDSMSTAEKGQFINGLQGKLYRFRGGQQAEYSAFLNECVQKHNAELRGWTQPRSPSPPVQQKAYGPPPPSSWASSAQNQQPIPYQTPSRSFQPPNKPYDAIIQYASELKETPEVISVILAVLVIITMLLSWVTIRIPLSTLGASSNIGISDIKASADAFGIADTFAQVNEFVQFGMKGVDTLLGVLGDSSFSSGIKDAVSRVQIATIAMFAVSALVVLSIIVLPVFICMTLMDKGYAVRVGQFGNMLAVMAATLFAVTVAMINSAISNALSNMGAMLGSFGGDAFGGSMFQISCTVWVFLTIAIGAANTIFLAYSMKKQRNKTYS